MEFYDLVQSVYDLDEESFKKRFRNPFLLEDDPEDVRSTRAPTHKDDDVPPVRRVFEVTRRDGTEGAVLIGRSPTSDVRIEEGSVSTRHAVLKRIPGSWTITDLHSTNGTRLGDTPLPPGIALPITPGTMIRLGPDVCVTFFEATRVHQILKHVAPRIMGAATMGQAVKEGTFRLRLFSATAEMEAAPASSPSLAKHDLSGQLVIARCDPLPSVTLGVGREVKIGRTAENDFVLPHSAVSRRHALLLRRPDQVVVRDLGSSNGTYVGDRPVKGEAYVEIGGAPVVVGPFEIHLVATAVALIPDDAASTTELRRDRLQGDLSTMPLAEMLQAAELNSRSGVIALEAADGTVGEIVFSDGAPLRATYGDEHGEKAILAMLSLSRGHFTYTPATVRLPGARQVEASFMKLLVEASRLSDEMDRTHSDED
jgi:pSer/pThr/pTyr-binding forkhead associated (FHA) protein